MAPLWTGLRSRLDRNELRLRRLGRHAFGRPAAVREEHAWLTLPDGMRVYAHVHEPPGDDELPGVLLVPGIGGAGTCFDGLGSVVSAAEVAALGCLVVHFDPPGLGRSWGTYDYSGPATQAATLAALEMLSRHPRVRRQALGLVAISLGVGAAVPVAADHGHRLRVSWLLDYEGPGARQVITSFGAIMVPAMGHGLDDDDYWTPREAVRHVGRLRCRYAREQAAEDHAQGGYVVHAVEMVNAAVSGGCPHVELNGERVVRPLGPRAVDDVRWRAGGRCQANELLLAAVARQIGD